MSDVPSHPLLEFTFLILTTPNDWLTKSRCACLAGYDRGKSEIEETAQVRLALRSSNNPFTGLGQVMIPRCFIAHWTYAYCIFLHSGPGNPCGARVYLDCYYFQAIRLAKAAHMSSQQKSAEFQSGAFVFG
jgi:hypothetical protein